MNLKKLCTISTFFIGFLSLQAQAENWPRYLGSDGFNTIHSKGIPTKWDNSNITWETQLSDMGQSSPIIWGNDIFITSSNEAETERSIFSINKLDGSINWTTKIKSHIIEKKHRLNTPATPSCATNGEFVVAFFGATGLHCLDMKGNIIWSKDLGKFPGFFGTAASPIILGNNVIQNCDAAGESDLIAFDLKTGKEVWKTKRLSKPKGGWSTPTLIKTDKREELILNGEFGVQSYNPKNGEPYWFCSSFNGRGSPSPAYKDGLLFIINGKPGDIYAVKPNGSGNVTSTHMAWHTERTRGRDLPSPVIAGEKLFTINMTGTATTYEPKSGKVIWSEKLGRGNYVASPLVANDHIYVVEESGKFTVIKPGNELNIIQENKITPSGKENFRSPIVVNGKNLFIRSSKKLYCITP